MNFAFKIKITQTLAILKLEKYGKYQKGLVSNYLSQVCSLRLILKKNYLLSKHISMFQMFFFRSFDRIFTTNVGKTVSRVAACPIWLNVAIEMSATKRRSGVSFISSLQVALRPLMDSSAAATLRRWKRFLSSTWTTTTENRSTNTETMTIRLIELFSN